MFLVFQRLRLGAHHLWQLQPSEQNMSFTPEVWSKCVCVCLITALDYPQVTELTVRFTSIFTGSQIEEWVSSLAWPALVCLWTWHAVPVKWASLGSPAKGNKSRTMWLAQLASVSRGEVAGRARREERDMHVDSMTALRRGRVAPSGECFSPKSCDLRIRAPLSNAGVSLSSDFSLLLSQLRLEMLSALWVFFFSFTLKSIVLSLNNLLYNMCTSAHLRLWIHTKSHKYMVITVQIRG